jgi:hypothetical protein
MNRLGIPQCANVVIAPVAMAMRRSLNRSCTPEQLAPGGILHYQTLLTDWLKWIDSCGTDLLLDERSNLREDEKRMVGCAPKAGHDTEDKA